MNNQKGVVHPLLIVAIVGLVLFLLVSSIAPFENGLFSDLFQKSSSEAKVKQRGRPFRPTPVVCTQDAQQCPDGSYVNRVPPNCEFAPCPDVTSTPLPSGFCKSDSDCSSGYTCYLPPYGCNPAIQKCSPRCVPISESPTPTPTPSSNYCRQPYCKVDSDCPNGYYCRYDPLTGYALNCGFCALSSQR